MIPEPAWLAPLWGAVVLSGVYHGANPGMGWPLAVSAALMERSRTALARALAMLALGHLAAMIAILLPVSAIAGLADWHREARTIAALLVIATGFYLLMNRRHPRILARVAPARLVLWSFLAATAHGAGMMLLPIFFGISAGEGAPSGHASMAHGLTSALHVALLHTAAMALTGGIIAFAVHRWFGLTFISRSWFNLELLWALSLVAVGVFGLHAAMGS